MLRLKRSLCEKTQPIWASFSGKRPRAFSFRILFELRFCCFERFCCFPEIFRVLHLCWNDDCSCWPDKSIWQVITCQVIWRLARGQGDKSTCQVNLSSWLVCQVELVTASGVCHFLSFFLGFRRPNLITNEKIACKKNLRIASASEKVFANFSCPFIACSGLSESSVFEWTRCKIWLRHDSLSRATSFSRYKQSRSASDTGSTQKMGTNKETESQRFSPQRLRTSQWSFWLWVVHMFLESKIFQPDENLRSFKLD